MVMGKAAACAFTGGQLRQVHERGNTCLLGGDRDVRGRFYQPVELRWVREVDAVDAFDKTAQRLHVVDVSVDGLCAFLP